MAFISWVLRRGIARGQRSGRVLRFAPIDVLLFGVFRFGAKVAPREGKVAHALLVGVRMLSGVFRRFSFASRVKPLVFQWVFYREVFFRCSKTFFYVCLLDF